jgi:SagB-type dehydrogenase family enzyme
MNFFLSHLHDDLRSSRLTKRGATHGHDQVPMGQHKTYPRLPRLALPEPEDLPVKLGDALRARNSKLADKGAPIMPQEIGTLLGLSVRKQPEGMNRYYPSTGATYPIETYLISTEVHDQKHAVYHYDPTAHALEELYALPHQFDMKSLIDNEAKIKFSTIVIFTSIWQRSSAKYGDIAYTLALLEAGHMSENMLLVGSALRLGVFPYEKFNDSKITELLDLDKNIEQPVNSVIIRKGVE